MPKANGRKFSNFTPRDIPSQVNQIFLYFIISNNTLKYLIREHARSLFFEFLPSMLFSILALFRLINKKFAPIHIFSCNKHKSLPTLLDYSMIFYSILESMHTFYLLIIVVWRKCIFAYLSYHNSMVFLITSHCDLQRYILG